VWRASPATRPRNILLLLLLLLLPQLLWKAPQHEHKRYQRVSSERHQRLLPPHRLAVAAIERPSAAGLFDAQHSRQQHGEEATAGDADSAAGPRCRQRQRRRQRSLPRDCGARTARCEGQRCIDE
jgi:hypothetical protein